MLNRIPAPLILLATAVFWSLGGVLIKSVSASALSIAGLRSLFAAVALFVLFREVRSLPKKSHLLGALAYTLTVLTFVSATRMTTAANAIFLQSTAPLYVFFISWLFLKERPPKEDFIFMPLIGFGMLCFFLGDFNATNLPGLALASVSGVLFAVFLSLMRHHRYQEPLKAIFYGNVMTALLTAPFYEFQTLEAPDWGLLIFLGCVQLALPYFLYSRTIHRLSAVDTSLILLLEPILNPLWVYLLLSELPASSTLLGGFMVLSTVALRAYFIARKSKPSVVPH